MTGSELARLARVTPETFNRAMRGYPVWPRTARRLMEALLAIPVAAGSDALLDRNGDDRPPIVPVGKPRRALRPNEGTPAERVDGRRVVEERPSRSRKAAAPSP
jgi:hypothetical protein